MLRSGEMAGSGVLFSNSHLPLLLTTTDIATQATLRAPVNMAHKLRYCSHAVCIIHTAAFIRRRGVNQCTLTAYLILHCFSPVRYPTLRLPMTARLRTPSASSSGSDVVSTLHHPLLRQHSCQQNHRAHTWPSSCVAASTPPATMTRRKCDALGACNKYCCLA